MEINVENIIDKSIDIINARIALITRGFIPPNSSICELNSLILVHNILTVYDVLDKDQKQNILSLYNFLIV